MKDIGVNWLRLAHYQQNDAVLQACDELGILVWEEVPFVRDSPRTPEFEQNTQNMLTDMIEQHFNHPAVIVWGMGNEIYFKKGLDGKALEFSFISHLNDTIHREDPVRKSVIVSGDANSYSELKIMTIPDVIGYNLYYGWYGGEIEELTARIEDLHRRDPSKPMIISEFGAGCDPVKHSEHPHPFDMSQEYQVYFLESYLQQLDTMPWLCGYNWWNFADFGWVKSSNPPLFNNKGLETFDRQKKDSYYAMQAHFSHNPVLYILSPSWTHRTGAPDKDFRVITNLPQVELFHQGKSLGIQHNGFIWHVKMVPGKNDLLARSPNGNSEFENGFSVQYTPGSEATSTAPTLPANDAANPFKH